MGAIVLHRRRRQKYSGVGSGLTVVGGAAILGGAALLYVYRDTFLEYAIQAAGLVGWYPDPSSRAAPYAQMIANASAQAGVDPSIIAGIGDRESGWGIFLSPKGPTGTGNGGADQGLMQLNAQYNPTANWQDPQTNITAGARIFADYRNQLSAAGVDDATLNQAAASAYNAGVGHVLAAYQAGQSVDSPTTGGNYGSDVMARAAKYAAGAS